MSKKKNQNSVEVVPNMPKLEVTAPTKLSDFYQKYYKILFDKLDKNAQESLTNNLKKGNLIIRGQIREFENVRQFIRDVIEESEAQYDKAQAKKANEESNNTKPAAV